MSDSDILTQLREQTRRLQTEAEPAGEHFRDYVAQLLVNQLIPEGLFVVLVDTQHPGLHGVPWDKLTEPQAVLKFSKNFPAKDLQVDAHVLTQTLSFDGRLSRVEIPVEAIYRIMAQRQDGVQVWAFREPRGDGDDGPQAG